MTHDLICTAGYGPVNFSSAHLVKLGFEVFVLEGL